MKLFEIISEKSELLNEGVFTDFMVKTFGKNFSRTIGSSVETLLQKSIDDVARGGSKVTLSSIKNSKAYKDALTISIAEASRVKFNKSFDDLLKTQKNDAQKLATDVQNGLDNELVDRAAQAGKLADDDLKAAQKNVTDTSKRNAVNKATDADLKAATKNLQVNQKLQGRFEQIKKVVAGYDQRTVTQISNLLKKDIKPPVVGTGQEIATKVAGETTILSGGKLFKLTKDQLKAFPGQVKQVIVNRPVLSTLVALGLTAAVLYLIFGEGTILTDENGNAIDDNGQINEWVPCVQELIKNGEGKIVFSDSGQMSVLVSPSEYPGGIKFYTNGRVFDVTSNKMGRYKCKEGQVTISEQNDNIPGFELMPYAYQYSRDNQTTPETSQQTTTDNAKIGLGNIEITWDTPGGGGGGGSTSRYYDCNSKSLPHEFGCRSEQIKKVQICLGLPEKYQTGNFGPITKKAIEDKGIDVSNGMTQSVIDKVCGSNENTPESEETTPSNREIINPITADRLKMSDLTMPKVDIKLPDIKPLEVSDEVFYNALRDNGNLIGEDGNNRIKYKGPDLDVVQLGKLDNVILPMGYTRIKNLEELKPYGSKYVWLKQ